MSRRISAAAAAVSAIVAIVLYAIEIPLPSLWAEARQVSLAYMWVARWAELLAQLLLLVAVLIAVSRMFEGVSQRLSPSTPTR